MLRKQRQMVCINQMRVFVLLQLPPTFESNDEAGDVAACSKRRVASEEDLLKDDLKKSRVEESDAEKTDGKSVEESESRAPESEEVKVEAEETTTADSAVKDFTIGETRPKKTDMLNHVYCPLKPNCIWY